MRASRLRDTFRGSPVALPRWLDVAIEQWWSLAPRLRAGLLTAAAAVLVLGGLGHAASTPYGPPTVVLVAVEDLPAGHQLSTRDVRRVTWPSAVVPDDALRTVQGRLALPVPAQTLVTERHVAQDGLAAGLAEGMAAVPVPTDALPSLTVGDRVEVVSRNLDGQATVLAAHARVLAIDDSDVWLAVPRQSAAEVAAAAASGLVTVVVLRS